MSTGPKTCTILPVPDDRFIEATLKAIEENPLNAPIRRLPPELAGLGGPRLELAVLTGKRWAPGRHLRVGFLGGASRIKERLVPFAKQWENHANVTLDFGGDATQAEIRVAFVDGAGSWSYLGTDALVIDAGKPTMNYGWLTPEGPDDEYSRVVIHEFGHALSCIHEHMHPEAGIPWDREKVYQYYQATQGWSREEVDRNVLNRYSASETNFSAYDPSSIMHYPVDNALTLGDFEIGWNRVLSPRDKEFIATIYPREPAAAVELKTAQPVSAEIGAHGEEDAYHFRISRTHTRATILTRGDTDVVMSLYGPNNRTELVAFDDDSGQNRNAKIQRSLSAGDYWVRVRHWQPEGIGTYQVELRLGS